jgi:DNA-binding transcriptional MerR regulator
MAAMDDEAAITDPRDADDLIPIGRFARLSGLSIGALRHYDELDLLRPADVDRFTGYRRYRRDQLDIARAIGRLRDLEVPIEDIRDVLGADDPADRRQRLGAHERRLQARVDRLVRLLHVTRQLQKEREPLMTATGSTTAIDALDEATHRQLAKDLFNHTWTLIEKPDRTPEEQDAMVHATHASAWHWSRGGGTLANAARGEWQVSRVYATLGRGEPALWHAGRALELAEAAAHAGVADDWDVPAALEGLARAQAVAGNRAAAVETRARARQALDAIADPEDRRVIEGDLETTPI